MTQTPGASAPAASSAPLSATPPASGRVDLTRYAWLSIGAAVLTIVAKVVAFLLTNSVGLLSDAAETLVNLVAAIVALYVLKVSAQPADKNHHFGHAKAEYFSAAVEGGMIAVAACFILYTAVVRFLNPTPLDNVGIGLGVSIIASLINGAVAFVIMRAGRAHRSLTLVADGKHLLTDVYTSMGIVVGIVLVWLTGWERLDPIVAFLVGINIIITGYKLLQESVSGLMDTAWPKEDNQELAAIFTGFADRGARFHGLRTREAGHQRFAEVHVLVPGEWTVVRGHDLIEEIEAAVGARFPDTQMMCHMEPLEDPRSYGDYPTEVAIDHGPADRGVLHDPPAGTVPDAPATEGPAGHGDTPR